MPTLLLASRHHGTMRASFSPFPLSALPPPANHFAHSWALCNPDKFLCSLSCARPTLCPLPVECSR